MVGVMAAGDRIHEMAPNLLCFHCPACGYAHHVGVNGRKIPGSNGSMNEWGWNGSFSSPTFTPSLLVNKESLGTSPRCHSFVAEGRIQFLGDCTHAMAGQTVDIPEWDAAPRIAADVSNWGSATVALKLQ
jgi:hypothetical protein